MLLPFWRFLEEKPLYYKEIDHTRIARAYAILKPHIRHPQTVHLVGTNAKGSTGRMVAHLAYKSGKRVGHYSSPHIVRFNERLWRNGEECSNEEIEQAHQRLFPLLGEEMSEALSYFEYTTLLAFVLFESCDLMVLEAGLGGEFDATNVCDKALSIITPIAIDHQAFLGESIEEIATTKLRSIQKEALLARQPYKEVLPIAKAIAKERGAVLHTIKGSKSNAQLEKIASQKGWGGYLVENAFVALKALEILSIPVQMEHLLALELFGRFYPLSENIHIDVGHNPLASQAIVEALQKEVVLIYNSLDDKDYKEVLRLLKPKIKRVEILPIETQRASTQEEIVRALEQLAIPYSTFQGKLEEGEHYLVFGSFYVVEAFLRWRENQTKEEE